MAPAGALLRRETNAVKRWPLSTQPIMKRTASFQIDRRGDFGPIEESCKGAFPETSEALDNKYVGPRWWG